jgi:glycosyltransferase involved in cell wall biosynthesis
MSPCHVLTLFLKIVTRKPIILDAGWSLTDGLVSRGIRSIQFWKLPLIALIDLFSFHLANIVLLESEAQIARVSKLFMIRKSKLRVQFTGLNETSFISKPMQSSIVSSVTKRIAELNNTLVVLFRGKINRESGFDIIFKAATALVDSVTFIFATGENSNLRNCPKNVITVPHVTDLEMKQIYSLSHVSIGQVSRHPRLQYTIPHKAFEAGFFSMPYITTNSNGVREYLNPNSAIFLNNPSTESLVDAILELKQEEVRLEYSTQINAVYRKFASQLKINEQFEETLLSLIIQNE